jgi:hypothetical protein
MSEIIFKAGTRSDLDDWAVEGEKISAPETLGAIKTTLAQEGPILVEHKFLRGGRGPKTSAFDEYDEFIEYLTSNARAGDKITVWSLRPFMRDTAPLASGKCPAEDGAVPKGGPY